MADLFDKAEIRQALRSWWERLEEQRGVRAHLRRARSLDDLLRDPRTPDERSMQWSILDLRKKLSTPDRPVRFGRVAPVAGLLARVRSDVSGENDFGRYLASGGDENRHGLSEHRFERLLRLETVADLYPQLGRVLAQLGNRAPIVALAESVYWWNDRTRREWARGYYDVLFDGESVEVSPEDKKTRGCDRLGQAAEAWWDALQDYPGERAALERCGPDLHAVQLARGFHRLRQYAAAVGQGDLRQSRQLAAVAAVLAHVRDAVSDEALNPRKGYGISLGELAASDKGRLAKVRAGENPKAEVEARLKEDRFRRLLTAEDRRDLVRPLIRAVIQLDREADVARLAADVFCWGKGRRGRWANDYYCLAQPE